MNFGKILVRVESILVQGYQTEFMSNYQNRVCWIAIGEISTQEVIRCLLTTQVGIVSCDKHIAQLIWMETVFGRQTTQSPTNVSERLVGKHLMRRNQIYH